MLPEFYRTNLLSHLSQSQLLTLEILVWLLQAHQQIKLERLAAYFPCVTLAAWLKNQKVYFVFRQKKDTNIKVKGKDYQQLNDFGYSPGIKMFLTELKVTQSQGFRKANIAAYWKRKYRGKVEKEPWYLLTNFANLEETVKAYKKRVGIEAMFKDCKTGGYNLEGSKANIERLTRLVLLIAIAYSFSTLKGKALRATGQQKYIGRLRKIKQTLTKNSNFWLGLYGDVWTIAREFVKEWVEKLMRLNPNKLPFYQKGLRAMTIIQQAL